MKSVHLSNLVELVPRVVNRMGKYQIFIIVLLSFNSAIVAINHTLTSFHIYTPTFHCSVSNLFGYLGISRRNNLNNFSRAMQLLNAV